MASNIGNCLPISPSFNRDETIQPHRDTILNHLTTKPNIHMTNAPGSQRGDNSQSFQDHLIIPVQQSRIHGSPFFSYPFEHQPLNRGQQHHSSPPGPYPAPYDEMSSAEFQTQKLLNTANLQTRSCGGISAVSFQDQNMKLPTNRSHHVLPVHRQQHERDIGGQLPCSHCSRMHYDQAAMIQPSYSSFDVSFAADTAYNDHLDESLIDPLLISDSSDNGIHDPQQQYSDHSSYITEPVMAESFIHAPDFQSGPFQPGTVQPGFIRSSEKSGMSALRAGNSDLAIVHVQTGASQSQDGQSGFHHSHSIPATRTLASGAQQPAAKKRAGYSPEDIRLMMSMFGSGSTAGEVALRLSRPGCIRNADGVLTKYRRLLGRYGHPKAAERRRAALVGRKE